jgi:hypothetical protein
MRFTGFKEFRGLVGSTLDDVLLYLRNDLKKFLRELQLGLTKLSFADNFESFQVTVTISAGAELQIRNELLNSAIPTKRIIVKGGSGAQDIVDGDTEWNLNYVYLKNTGASTATATVVFLK